MSTECDTTTIAQVIDCDSVSSGGSNGQFEEGITPIAMGQAYVDVSFMDPHPSYSYDELVIENFADNPPLCLLIGPIVFSDETGFRVMLSASADSEFYQLRWRVTV